jgi:hypothetical protein
MGLEVDVLAADEVVVGVGIIGTATFFGVGVAQAVAMVSAAMTTTIFLPDMAFSIPPPGSSYVTVRI